MPITVAIEPGLSTASTGHPGRFERFLTWLLPQPAREPASFATALAMSASCDPVLLAEWLEAENRAAAPALRDFRPRGDAAEAASATTTEANRP